MQPDNVVSVLVELGHGVVPVRRLLMLPERAPAEHQRRVGGVRRRCTRMQIIARGSEVHGLGGRHSDVYFCTEGGVFHVRMNRESS